jgi:hypothetical protein
MAERVSGLDTPATVDSAFAVAVQFVCANAAHRSPRGRGSLVWHHGTCGYCPGDALAGLHAWIDASDHDPWMAPAKRRASPRNRERADWVPAMPMVHGRPEGLSGDRQHLHVGQRERDFGAAEANLPRRADASASHTI